MPPTPFRAVYTHLLTLPAPTFPPPTKLPTLPAALSSGPWPLQPADPASSDAIASLRVHPALEAALHLLNHDLPSAHFLLRKMQAPPAVEGMYLHGLLHRLEADWRNARLWFGDVKEACESKEGGEERGLWDYVVNSGSGGGKGASLTLMDEVEAWKEQKDHSDAEKRLGDWRKRSRNEIERVVEWCLQRFGEAEWEDATKAYVKSGEKVQKIKESMTTGGKGYRDF